MVNLCARGGIQMRAASPCEVFKGPATEDPRQTADMRGWVAGQRPGLGLYALVVQWARLLWGMRSRKGGGESAAEKKLPGLTQKKKTLVIAHRQGASRRTVHHNDWLC